MRVIVLEFQVKARVRVKIRERVETPRYETPGYKKVRVRNVRKPAFEGYRMTDRQTGRQDIHTGGNNASISLNRSDSLQVKVPKRCYSSVSHHTITYPVQTLL